MSAELAIGLGAIALVLAAFGAGMYRLGVAVICEMLDGDE